MICSYWNRYRASSAQFKRVRFTNLWFVLLTLNIHWSAQQHGFFGGRTLWVAITRQEQLLTSNKYKIIEFYITSNIYIGKNKIIRWINPQFSKHIKTCKMSIKEGHYLNSYSFKISKVRGNGLTSEIYQQLPVNLVPQKHLPAQSQQQKHYKKVWNIFKISNKRTRTRSMTSIWCLCC